MLQLHAHLPDEVTLAQLSKELWEVSDWFSLGLHLDIPPAEFYDIKHDLTLCNTGVQDRDAVSIYIYMDERKSGASWPRVVTILIVFGRETLAHKIALKFGKTV